MDKDIRFTGYTAVPSDFESTDGELAQSYNLINEDGAIQPIFSPKVLCTLADGQRVVFIHNTAAYKHFIVMDNSNAFYWFDGEELKEGIAVPTLHDIPLSDSAGKKFSHINAVGNTLLIVFKDGMHYILWAEDKYTDLGNHLPHIELSFGLKGYPKLYSQEPKIDSDDDTTDSSKLNGHFTITFNKIPSDEIPAEFSDENKSKITSQVMAKVNSFLRKQTIEKGRFALPFMVRYALRLYDGSLVCHSAPILMNPSTTAGPVVWWDRIKGKNDNYTTAECDIMLVASELDYQLVRDVNAEYARLDLWKDIVKSVDVFISMPIYTYDQSGMCESFNDSDNFDTKFIGALQAKGFGDRVRQNYIYPGALSINDTVIVPGDSVEETGLTTYYTEWSYKTIFCLYGMGARHYPTTTIHLPEHTDEKKKESISNVANFYLLKSIPTGEYKSSSRTYGELATERTTIEVADDYLQSLAAREVMTDDYLSNDRLMPSYSQVYNSRLNLAGIKRELFCGYSYDSMFAYTNHDGCSWDVDTSHPITLQGMSLYGLNLRLKSNDGASGYAITTYIKENGEKYEVTARNTLKQSEFSPLINRIQKMSSRCWLFYPNVNAYKMEIKNTHGQITTVDLKPHDFLNGAYALLDYEEVRGLAKVTSERDALPCIVDVPNKIYTSDVNNPFRFPVTGINTIGTGTIVGISTAAKALSQGQFGQFPLYAFTDEGVWALEVSSSGGYSAKQPITRDVCKSPKSITQIDSSVLFATDRGIMEISGSQTTCLTDVINGRDFFDIVSLPGLTKLYPSGLPHVDCTFADYRRNARMTYDYINQRIILFNPEKDYAYVFSIKSKMWGIMASSLSSAVNSYPDAYAMATVNSHPCLVDISRSQETHANGLLVTRPLKLGDASVLKTIDTIIQQGMFQKTHVQQVLYGSRDLVNWSLIWSSADKYLRGFRGTPYKYFRLAVVCNLDSDESVYGFSCRFEPRLINTPR